MNFPRQIKRFLTQVGANDSQRLAIVPKSDSAGDVNDVMIFRYKRLHTPGRSGMRVLVLKQPITKEARTGNLLLTGTFLPVPAKGRDYTPADLDTAFEDREDLPDERYRTYIMSRIIGPLYRLR